MKKIIAGIIAGILLLGMSASAEPKAIDYSDFVITSDGELTAYYGEEWVVIPEKINGIPVLKIGE